MKFLGCSIALLVLSLVAPRMAAADEVMADGFPYSSATILGIRNDQLAFTLNAREIDVDLSKVSTLAINKSPKFNEAEQVRDSDARKAAALYKEALQREMTSKALRPLAQLRAIAPTDADGRYSEAMALFLNVYQQFPSATIWTFRPTHLPGPGSTLLKESADLIGSRLPAFTDAEARKNLQLLQVDLYGKAGDTKAAAALARAVTGASPAGETGSPAAAVLTTDIAITPADLAPINEAISGGKANEAIAMVEQLLPRANAEGAAQLLMAKARAYAAGKQPELAAAAYLRVPIHYPQSSLAAASLLAAADLQKMLNHADEAARLYKELAEKYPDAPEAVKNR